MRRRPFLDQRRPSFKRRWQQRPWWVRLALSLLLALACVLLLLVLLGSPDPGSSPSNSASSSGSATTDSPLLRQRSYLEGATDALNMTNEMLSARSFSRQLMDQIYLAKTYIVVAKEANNLQFVAELSAQVRRAQSILAHAAAHGDSVMEQEAEKAIRDMSVLLFHAQQFRYDSGVTIMKLKGQIQSLEEKSKAEADKSTKYGQIAAEELPKGLYCLGVRLTMEWFKSPELQRKFSDRSPTVQSNLKDNSLYHYCVFSDNILAVSVVVNSTAINSKHPEKIVFHLVTDELNYAPMKAWFALNDFRGVTVEIQQVEDFTWLNASYVPVLKQLQNAATQKFYFSGSGNRGTPIKFRNPKYLSMLNHLRFYIPEIYPELDKVLFLDDDIVVQRDLSELFTINLNGNVMGAVETCMETFHRFHKYLNHSHPLIRAHFDPDACGWAFGMNVLDLVEWRKKNVTGIYHYWQERNADHTLWKLGSLPPGLLAFYGLVEALDPKWHVLGLGYTTVDPATIKEGAVLHYNGNMKPWLKIGMEKYKSFWDNYVDYSHPLLQRCFMR